MYILIDSTIRGKGKDDVLVHTYDNIEDAQEDLAAEFNTYTSDDNTLDYGAECFIDDDYISAWAQIDEEYKIWQICQV